MQFSPDTPVVEITIQGVKFNVPQPYRGGKPLSKNEAVALNQALVDNVRQNFAARMKYAKKKEQPIPGQDEFNAYLSEYEFGVKPARRGTKAPVDPVQKEAERLAWEMLKPAIAAAGHEVKGIDPDKKAELIAGALEKKPELREEAARRVNATASIDLSGLIG